MSVCLFMWMCIHMHGCAHLWQTNGSTSIAASTWKKKEEANVNLWRLGLQPVRQANWQLCHSMLSPLSSHLYHNQHVMVSGGTHCLGPGFGITLPSCMTCSFSGVDFIPGSYLLPFSISEIYFFLSTPFLSCFFFFVVLYFHHVFKSCVDNITISTFF